MRDIGRDLPLVLLSQGASWASIGEKCGLEPGGAHTHSKNQSHGCRTEETCSLPWAKDAHDCCNPAQTNEIKMPRGRAAKVGLVASRGCSCRRAGTAVFDCKPPASGIFDFETSGSLAQVPHLHECSIASGVSTQKQRKLPNVASLRRQHQSGNPLSVLRQLESLFYTVSSRP
jgi:hypothetical protein